MTSSPTQSRALGFGPRFGPGLRSGLVFGSGRDLGYGLLACAAALAISASSVLAQQGGSSGNRQQARPAAPADEVVPQPRQEKQYPLGAAWTAVSQNGKSFPGERPTLTIDDTLRAKGFAGCNTFSATAYPLREQGLAVGPVAVTRRSCEAGLNASERSFLVALRGARKWDLVQGQLVLSGAAGELRFERAL